jgi:hypothetical protein
MYDHILISAHKTQSLAVIEFARHQFDCTLTNGLGSRTRPVVGGDTMPGTRKPGAQMLS